MIKPYYLIEHETRGVYVGHECYGDGKDWNRPRPRFRWSIPRSEGQLFFSLSEARRALSSVIDIVPTAYLLWICRDSDGRIQVLRYRGGNWYKFS